ncbi:MAG: D-alanine--D-alanine ligase [Neomegalonema sp.]|nr:D-alanine--D-alanine ligase [Neomegalonema sp.]
MSDRRFSRIALLMGGPSAEREVSLVSGRECAAGLRAAGYEVIEIDAGPDLAEQLKSARPDAAFNALHGRWGEDGCVQGLLEWLRIPYSHSGVYASALAMDKARAKAVYMQAGIPVVAHLMAEAAQISAAHVMPPPYVVKPNNEGSSVGIHVVTTGANTPPQIAAKDAPHPLMVEEYVAGRELTVAVMGDRPLCVTEIIASGWYDYDAKYSIGGSRHVLPADLPPDITAACLEHALAAHQALGCRGISRSDFRFDDHTPGVGNGKLIILETNTQPGMTPTSLVPEQAAHLGISFPELVSWIVEDASLDR